MIDHSFYQMIHPEDVDKIKDQLATEETADTRILDLKSEFVNSILIYYIKYIIIY